MYIGLFIILAMILILPFTLHFVENNLELFLFVMGIAAVTISGTLSFPLIGGILENYLLYMITGAVLVAGLLFKVYVNRFKRFIDRITVITPLSVFIFLVIVVLGLVSSIITAIVASLILVEIINVLDISRKSKTMLAVTACFSIGLGAVLTPVGEPLATIVVSNLEVDFFYLFKNMGVYIIPGILAVGVFGGLIINMFEKDEAVAAPENTGDMTNTGSDDESIALVIIRALKVFIFVIALELLSHGFKPIIDTYIIHLNSKVLYWINTSSAVLDNATLAASEISSAMSSKQIQAILMGLLISGGMLIPGNIPNIISAGKLKIKSKEWAKMGVPIGLTLMLSFFIILFLV